MNSSTAVENIYLLVIVTLISVLQNAFFAQKVERECQKENKHTPSFERVSCANRNCMDAYPTFLAVMWCAGVCLSQAPAAFAGIIYLLVRQKYFIGYLGDTSQRLDDSLSPNSLKKKEKRRFVKKQCLISFVALQHARLHVWKTHHRLPAPDVHPGNL
uniref:Arachidonate 5-lipoxygenase-activating protein n=1 Tax=Oryzias latipes TaxID=8090 RepID=A0A3B3HG96_ORYLA